MSQSYSHPWNLGIMPSEYIETKRSLDDEIQKAIGEITLDRLDELFLYTLKCPPLRNLDLDVKKDLLRDSESLSP